MPDPIPAQLETQLIHTWWAIWRAQSLAASDPRCAPLEDKIGDLLVTVTLIQDELVNGGRVLRTRVRPRIV